MSISVFVSTVSDEFRRYRDQLRTDLTRHNVEVKVQEDSRGLASDRPAPLAKVFGARRRTAASGTLEPAVL